jgi:SulP family sulfate permease
VGVVLSAVLFMKRMADISDKRINNIIDTDIIEDYMNVPDGISIYEISGPLFFASAKRYSEVIEEVGIKSKVLIIRMRHVSFIDETGMHNLKDTLAILHQKGVVVILSGLSAEVSIDIEKAVLKSAFDKKYLCNSFDEAIDMAKNELNKI